MKFILTFFGSVIATILFVLMLNSTVNALYRPSNNMVAAELIKAKKMAVVAKPAEEAKATESAKKAEPSAKPAATETKVAAVAAPKKKKRHPGKRLYLRKSCMACHGKGGARPIQEYPALAGQSEKYLIGQVNDILSGKRVGSNDQTGAMRTSPMTGALITPEGEVRIKADEIAKIANWLSMQKPAKPKALDPAPTEEVLAAGQKLYKKKCRSCHGKGALKPLKGYPILAGMRKTYIIAQVNDVKNKIRKNGKIKVMVGVVKKLTDEQIDAVATYLSQIDRSK